MKVSQAHAHANVINSMIQFNRGDLKLALSTAKNSRYKGSLIKNVCVEVIQTLAKPVTGRLSYGEGLVIGEVIQNALRLRDNQPEDAIQLVKGIMPKDKWYRPVLEVLADLDK